MLALQKVDELLANLGAQIGHGAGVVGAGLLLLLLGSALSVRWFVRIA